MHLELVGWRIKETNAALQSLETVLACLHVHFWAGCRTEPEPEP